MSGRLRYLVSIPAIIDLLAVVWFYLPMFFSDPGLYGIVGMLKFLVIFKLIRYSSSLMIFVHVFTAKKRQLAMILYLVLFILIVASSLMYFVERTAQPDKFGSVPEAMWWGVITLTTVGYGDTVPVTMLGKILAGVVALFGIGLFALPAGILASGFMDEFSKEKDAPVPPPEKKTLCCPNCGTMIGLNGEDMAP